MVPLVNSIGWIIAIFVIGYLFIIFENVIKIHKSTTALMMAVLCWVFFFCIGDKHECNIAFVEIVESVAEIVLFLLGALTIVETINVHHGFKIITNNLRVRSKLKMLWLIGIITFFLSAVLDNLTTTIVMVTLCRKLIEDKKELLLIGASIVISANAGGAWTPIGDVTTTMLWIGGQVTSQPTMQWLFLPSFICMVVSNLWFSFHFRGNFKDMRLQEVDKKFEEGGRLIFFLGIGSLVFVPIFKVLTGLPPFMGMLFGLSVLWIVTDIMHHKHSNRQHLMIPSILTKIDVSAVLFFLGVLLAVGALDGSGILDMLAVHIQTYIPVGPILAIGIGLVSAVIDNVPLVAACMGMFNLTSHPPDSPLWQMLAYTAGTGGSILIIGSAAGVAYMAMERVTFGWYCKYVSLPALLSYLAGFGVYLLIR